MKLVHVFPADQMPPGGCGNAHTMGFVAEVVHQTTMSLEIKFPGSGPDKRMSLEWEAAGVFRDLANNRLMAVWSPFNPAIGDVQ